MPIQVQNNNIELSNNRNIPLDDLPALKQAHLSNVLGTVELENFARHNLFPVTQDSVSRLCRHVFQWGGDRFEWANRGSEADGNKRAAAIQSAMSYLVGDNLVGACKALEVLHGFGVSYASKHLRFIMPEKCAVLDSVIQTCNYGDDAVAFERYSQDCLKVTHALAVRGVLFRVADVDMAIYAFLKGWLGG